MAWLSRQSRNRACPVTSMTAAQLSLRPDLVFSRQETDGGVVFVVKEPSSGRFFRIGEVEHFIARQFDGATPIETVRQRVEERFGASLDSQTLGQFIEKLWGRGLLERDASSAPIPHHARGRIRGNLLYPRLKAFDPDRLLDRLVGKVRVFFTAYFVVLSIAAVVAAVGVLVANSEEVGRDLLGILKPETVLDWKNPAFSTRGAKKKTYDRKKKLKYYEFKSLLGAKGVVYRAVQGLYKGTSTSIKLRLEFLAWKHKGTLFTMFIVTSDTIDQPVTPKGRPDKNRKDIYKAARETLYKKLLARKKGKVGIQMTKK